MNRTKQDKYLGLGITGQVSWSCIKQDKYLRIGLNN